MVLLETNPSLYIVTGPNIRFQQIVIIFILVNIVFIKKTLHSKTLRDCLHYIKFPNSGLMHKTIASHYRVTYHDVQKPCTNRISGFDVYVCPVII